jgi:hypothetical protein
VEVYVQSGGVSKEYSWLKEPDQTIVLPDNDLKPMLKMVDSDYFSVVLYRPQEGGNKLLLLVTALKSQNRIDNRTRKICNSLLWVGDNSDEDEATLRSLSIQALNDELATKIDQAVFSENNAQGFKVNFKQLKPENLVNSENLGNQTDGSHKVGNLSALKDSLIDDLKKYSLPKHDGMLVVVCSTVSQSSLEREKVWRGLSDSIPGDEWIDNFVGGAKEEGNFPHPPSLPSSNTPTTAKSVSPNSQNNAGKNNGNNKDVQSKQGLTMGQKVLSILLAISIIINIGLFLKWQEAIENKKEYENLKLTLKTEGETLNKIVKFNEKYNTEGRQLLDEINNIKGIQK